MEQPKDIFKNIMSFSFEQTDKFSTGSLITRVTNDITQLQNFLGGMSCYWLGMLGKVEWIEKYLKLDPVKLQKVQDWIKGKGSWMGFFVFLPGIGDFIAVALGFLRANIWVVAISMFLGKAIRYWVWMEFVYKVQSMF